MPPLQTGVQTVVRLVPVADRHASKPRGPARRRPVRGKRGFVKDTPPATLDRNSATFFHRKELTMKTATWKTSPCLSLVVGLLVLAGICLDGRHALAQVDCPLPAGVTAPPDPSVTAQEVEDGSATLEAFALAATERFKSGGSDVLTPQQLAYSGCRLRQENGPLYSGSTYIVTLTPEGRVYLHAKNMSLSAGKVNSAIYLGILSGLGIPRETLDGLRSPDPATRRSAQSMLVGELGREPGRHGPFDLSAPDPGVRPGFPGASGYAAAYTSVNTDQPHVLLAGFDLDASHLVEEDIDYGDPAITASEVVDRYTLKRFVGQALRFIAGTVRSAPTTAESRVAFQQARLALRDPDGPWRHGPVYVTMQDPETDLIVFHGAFPDRFELRRGGISRDVATGELIYQQLLDAADSSPEGGFWLYHFDNPADDTDSTEVPKVGYAREFTRRTTTSDGTEIRTRLVIASGFYLTADGEFVQRILKALDDGQESMMFGMTAPEEGDVVAGDAVTVSVTGAPTETVHFAYRPAGMPDEGFTYLGAATNREGVASFTWDTLDLPDDDYELVALYTEDEGEVDEGEMVIYDSIEVSVDNIGGGGGGCVAVPVLPGGGGPLDPTLPALVGLLLLYLMVGRRPMRQSALG